MLWQWAQLFISLKTSNHSVTVKSYQVNWCKMRWNKWYLCPKIIKVSLFLSYWFIPKRPAEGHQLRNGHLCFIFLLYIGSHLQSLNTSLHRDKYFSPHKVPYFMSLKTSFPFTSSFLWNSLLAIRLQPSARASLPANLTASAASPCGELTAGVNEPDWLLLSLRESVILKRGNEAG